MRDTAARASRNVGGQVNGNHLVPILVAQLNEQIVPIDTGIRDQNVELLHFFFRARHQRFNGILIRQDRKAAHAHDLPSAAATASSASLRVPEIATVAPCACSARAIAPPIAPLAPVTSAVLPFKSNIMGSSPP